MPVLAAFDEKELPVAAHQAQARLAGLSGNQVTFLAFGYAPTGKLESTNRETVTFQ